MIAFSDYIRIFVNSIIYKLKAMKKFIFALLLTAIFSAYSHPSEARNLRAFFSYATFYSPQDGPYIETYLSVLASSLTYLPNANGKFQGTLEITILFKQNDSIRTFRKYNLLSPEVTDTNQTNFVFHDQQRIILPKGQYTMEMIISDKNSGMPAYTLDEPISVEYNNENIWVSAIELVERYTTTTTPSSISKAGYDLIPLPVNFYPTSVNKLPFYAEIYNTEEVLGSGEKYLLRTYIESYEYHRKIDELIFQKREDVKPVNVLFHEFDISNLPTGNYNLVIEVRNKNNELLSVSQVFFERTNSNVEAQQLASDADVTGSFIASIDNRDTICEFIRCLRPISTESEKYWVDQNIKTADMLTLKRYFLFFWEQRSPDYPELGWRKYKFEVDKVNANYSTAIRKGYETDRGRVYLQYGPPNSISESLHESSLYPYEIWHYYTLLNQRDRKFVFYNPDLVTNDYELIHSDAIGEITDYQWKLKLKRRDFITHNPDETETDFGWGSRVNDYYNFPR